MPPITLICQNSSCPRPNREFTVHFECFRKRRYCSLSCAVSSRNRVDNPAWREDVREKMSIAMSKRMKVDNPMRRPEVAQKFSELMTKRNLEGWRYSNPEYREK